MADGQWPIAGPELDQALAQMGGALLANTLPRFLAGDITPTGQSHEQATYCGRLSKDDSKLELDPHQLPTGEAAEAAFNKIKAFVGIGDTWFIHDEKRIKIK